MKYEELTKTDDDFKLKKKPWSPRVIHKYFSIVRVDQASDIGMDVGWYSKLPTLLSFINCAQIG